MHFQATVRYGGPRSRYHQETLEVEDLREALTTLAERLPDEVLSEGDLIEIRPVVDPDARQYLGEDTAGGTDGRERDDTGGKPDSEAHGGSPKASGP